MSDVIRFFANMYGQLANLLDSVQFNIGGYYVSWLNVLLSFVALCIIVSVFWKGARK